MIPPYCENVFARYGAPMGRRDDEIPPGSKCYLRPIPWVDGDYDPGGAYWGGGRGVPRVWCAWDADGRARYVRAWTREEAKGKFPGLRFYR